MLASLLKSEKPGEVLVIRCCPIDDMHKLIQTIKNASPDTNITLLVQKELFDTFDVDQKIVYNYDKFKVTNVDGELIKSLRNRKFDMVILPCYAETSGYLNVRLFTHWVNSGKKLMYSTLLHDIEYYYIYTDLLNWCLPELLSDKIRRKLIRRKFIPGNRYSYQLDFVDFKISEGDKVLDIGSGGHPFPLATHLADLHIEETSHRPSEKLVIDNRPFINCNIEELPFDDNEFDFVYCSHVLEHVENPAKACNEIMRIGKRGYIETPTKTSDTMFNFLRLKNHHKWHVVKIANTLFFFEFQEYERRDLRTNYFVRNVNSPDANPFQTLVRGNRDLFSNMLLWEDGFFYYIFDKHGKLIATNLKNRGRKWTF